MARRQDRLEEVAAEIGERGGRALAVSTDLTAGGAAAAAVAQVVGELGQLDILVNNAGVMLTGPVADAPHDEWGRMLDLNVRAVLEMTRHALPHLVAAADSEPRRVADVVNISSTAGRRSRPGSAVYSLTKFGVNAFTESLRQEMHQHHVRVAVVEPGTTDTELRTHLRAEQQERTAATLAGLTMLRPENIADAICWTVTRPRHVAVNEVLVRATEQSW